FAARGVPAAVDLALLRRRGLRDDLPANGAVERVAAGVAPPRAETAPRPAAGRLADLSRAAAPTERRPCPTIRGPWKTSTPTPPAGSNPTSASALNSTRRPAPRVPRGFVRRRPWTRR